MLRRCYRMADRSYKTYGAKGVSVCSSWHNFQTFATWYEENYPKDGRTYQLDKDKLSGLVKIYSPETCVFLLPQENSELSHSKIYKFTSPDGECVEIFNLDKFCRKNGLTAPNMRHVLSGRRKHHKGWTRYVVQ